MEIVQSFWYEYLGKEVLEILNLTKNKNYSEAVRHKCLFLFKRYALLRFDFKQMKKYKKDIITILEVLAFLILWIGYSFFDNPIISYVGASLLFIFWILNIVDKVRYRNNKIQNEFRFPTANDDYSKFTALTLGSCFLIGSIGFAIWISEFSYILVLTGLAGILLLLNGFLDTPKGSIIFKQNQLTGTGIDLPLKNETINSIEISDEEIIYSMENSDNLVHQEAKLNDEWKEKIRSYLKNRLDTQKVEIQKA